MTDAKKLETVVKFAKAMGLVRWHGSYLDESGRCFVHDKSSPGDSPRCFAPWTNPPDAVELAEEMGIYYRRDYYQRPYRQFAAWRQWKPLNAIHSNDSDMSDEVRGGSLCEAICLAVLECLECLEAQE